MAHLLSWSLFVWWTEQVVKDCTETLKKAEEVLRTGTMARIVSFRQDPRMTALRDLAQVWGIGLKQAAELYAAGFSTLQSLRTPEGQRRLNRVQKLGLKYHEDLTLRIPRDEITEMVALIRETAEGLVGPSKVDGLRVVGVGSCATYEAARESHPSGVSTAGRALGVRSKLIFHFFAQAPEDVHEICAAEPLVTI